MLFFFSSDTEQLRAEIAVTTAKRKTAKQILGNNHVRDDILSDNPQIEEAVSVSNDLFFSDTQPARLLHLRKLALRMMEEL